MFSAYLPRLDCTPKAVSHRLTNIRKGGTIHANNGAVNSPTPKKSGSRARATPRKKKAVSEEVESVGLQGLVDGEEEVLLNPTAACGKRGMSGGVKRKVEYKEDSDQEDGEGEDGVEEEYVPLAKRVKEELVEEAALVEELVDTEV
jgi:hypothetical protein